MVSDVCRTIRGKIMASLWSTDCCQTWASSWMRNSRYRLLYFNRSSELHVVTLKGRHQDYVLKKANSGLIKTYNKMHNQTA